MDSSDDDDCPYSHTNVVKMLNDLKAQKDVVELNSEEEEVEDLPTPTVVTRSRAKRASRNSKKGNPKANQTTPTDVINLDSTLDLTVESEEDEFEEQVNSIWGGDFSQVHRFSFKRKQPLNSVFEYYANLRGVSVDNIRVMVKMRDVTPYDTLDSLDFRVSNFLEANLTKESDDKSLFSYSSYDDSEKLEFKCLMKNCKKPLIVKLHPKQPMHFFYQLCATELGCPVDSLSLRFDGETISQTDTAESLDLDGGECFHLYQK